ncbi:5-formyltetrahydrofolate cyclo-ligase [Arsenicicoccus sp. MKL-02]|uniref:5-formyltetrahydrofolate cyclo-ligase n=1 Tax=Arsenicicoccus cauae TaxID=2663847 RepID=A0A6I3IB43_9MICO|nr:5-formyltetrahydrofolate cyclo-ligase [Arsenicicoccus cauae]MTB70917.1 5-formyltetrahydrofolate cyclo-ligase [Arsenicicoccus cauae]
MDTPAPTPADAKRALRARLWAHRKQRYADTSRAEREAQALADHVLRIVADRVGPGGTVTSYESWPTEPGTGPLNAALAEAGYRVLVPVTLPGLDLDWRPLGSDERDESARLGLEAIDQADLVLTPGTAVDRRGVRLGQGGGCYDRALPRRREGICVVTLLHPQELLDDALPAAQHDQRVDAVVTADGITWLDR